MKPLLFLDVDGPLNPYDLSRRAARRAGYRTRRLNGYRVHLNHGHGKALRELPYTLVWATTWEHDANQYIGPHIGLPELPVVEWPGRGPGAPSGLYFKTPPLVKWADGRPFAWVDDEIGPADRAWVAAHHPAPALLHHVDPAVGLTASDFAALTAWTNNLGVGDEIC